MSFATWLSAALVWFDHAYQFVLMIVLVGGFAVGSLLFVAAMVSTLVEHVRCRLDPEFRRQLMLANEALAASNAEWIERERDANVRRPNMLPG